jgi:hypothetical protein
MWKEEVMAYFKVLSHIFLERQRRNINTLVSKFGLRQRFESGTSLM